MINSASIVVVIAIMTLTLIGYYKSVVNHKRDDRDSYDELIDGIQTLIVIGIMMIIML